MYVCDCGSLFPLGSDDELICPDCGSNDISILQQLIKDKKKYLELIMALLQDNLHQIELIKALIHTHVSYENLQTESYQFLNDDKKMAAHFKMKFPTSGIRNSMREKSIHDYVEDNSYDTEAAGKALIKIAEMITRIKQGGSR